MGKTSIALAGLLLLAVGGMAQTIPAPASIGQATNMVSQDVYMSPARMADFWNDIGIPYVLANGGGGTSTTNFNNINVTNTVTAGTYYGNGTGLTNLQGSNVVGAVSNATTAGTATNWVGVLTPTNAAADGITDDSLAVSNLFYNLNSGNGLEGSLLGKTYYIKYPSLLPVITSLNTTLENGTLITDSTNGAMIKATPLHNGNCGFRIQGVSILRTGSSIPNTNSVGIYLGYGLTGSGFTENNSISQCTVSNFSINIMEWQTLQTIVERCFLGNAWSQMIYFTQEGGTIIGSGQQCDANTICNNDLNALDCGATPYQQTNTIAIQCDRSYGLTIFGNNGGGCKQIAVIANSGYIEFNDNWEAIINNNTNLTAFYFTNSIVVMNNVHGGYLDTNHDGVIGLDGCNLDICSFSLPNPTVFRIFSFLGVSSLPQISPGGFTVRFSNGGATSSTYYLSSTTPNVNLNNTWVGNQKWQDGNPGAYLFGANINSTLVSSNTEKAGEFYGLRWSDGAAISLFGYDSWGSGNMNMFIGGTENGGLPAPQAIIIDTSPNDSTEGIRQWVWDGYGNYIPQGNQTIGSSGNPVAYVYSKQFIGNSSGLTNYAATNLIGIVLTNNLPMAQLGGITNLVATNAALPSVSGKTGFVPTNSASGGTSTTNFNNLNVTNTVTAALFRDNVGDYMSNGVIKDLTGDYMSNGSIEDSGGDFMSNDNIEDYAGDAMVGGMIEDSSGDKMSGGMIADSSGDYMFGGTIADSSGDYMTSGQITLNSGGGGYAVLSTSSLSFPNGDDFGNTIFVLFGVASIQQDTGGHGGSTLQLNASDNGTPMYLHVTSLGVATWTTSP
jgi:hypothetical protein